MATRVLLPGMAFGNIGNTDKRAARDRTRILRLQHNNQTWQLQTLNKDDDVQNCQPHSHVKADFARRGVKSVINEFRIATNGQGTDLPFSFVILDYFAFSAYMNDAYTTFMRDTLPLLFAEGLFDDNTRFILPKRIASTFWHADELLKHGLDVIESEELEATENPLYVATSELTKTQLSGVDNEKELELFENPPFVQYRIRFTRVRV
jgi:hypothetical protein